jgi:N6-adenosine-specific RNA methylase IME4
MAERYGVILADCPWRYTFGTGPRSRPRPQDHYPTLTEAEIKGLPVAEVAAPDCVLFLWATSPNLRAALEVMQAWGFEYKTSAIWHKSGIGMGYYWRINHELLLLGTRGSPSIPEPKVRESSVFWARKGQHSRKPWRVYEMIERMYPDAHRLELFCRTPQPGWDSWGLDAYPNLFSGLILPAELKAEAEDGSVLSVRQPANGD